MKMEYRNTRAIYYLAVLSMILCSSLVNSQPQLIVNGSFFQLNYRKVFMSGMNLGWYQYGNDFGNGQYDCCTGPILEQYLERIHDAGGNSIRIYLHGGGQHTPQFNSSGFAIAPDAAGTMISDLTRFLDVAEDHDIIVFIVLWNGAARPTANAVDLMVDDDKVLAYFENVLRPIIDAVKEKVAFGAFDLISEPEGLVHVGQNHEDPCLDTTILEEAGAGWTNTYLPMFNILRTINLLATFVHNHNWETLVTASSWSEVSRTDLFGYQNYFSPQCLLRGIPFYGGFLNFDQIHTFATDGAYHSYAPLNMLPCGYGTAKPVIVGQLSQVTGDGRTLEDMFLKTYQNNYCGAFSWQATGEGEASDSFETQARALAVLKDMRNYSVCGDVRIFL